MIIRLLIMQLIKLLFLCSIPISWSKRVITSAEILFHITINQLSETHVYILSVLSDTLLVGHYNLSELYIYNWDGTQISTISVSEELWDASWTPGGDIVYTTSKFNSGKVVLIKKSGSLIKSYPMIQPRCLTVLNNDIYLADSATGVYQSKDDGVSWDLVIQSCGGWHCWQVIKVTSADSDDYWTLERHDDNSWHIRVYYVNRKRADCNVTWKDLSSISADSISLSWSRLAFDGISNNIFLSDFKNCSIHVFSVDGQYLKQLPLSKQIYYQPYRLTMDKDYPYLYVGQYRGIVDVFKITYEDD